MLYINSEASLYEILEDYGFVLKDLSNPPEVFEIDTVNYTYSLVPNDPSIEKYDIKDFLEVYDK